MPNRIKSYKLNVVVNPNGHRATHSITFLKFNFIYLTDVVETANQVAVVFYENINARKLNKVTTTKFFIDMDDFTKKYNVIDRQILVEKMFSFEQAYEEPLIVKL